MRGLVIFQRNGRSLSPSRTMRQQQVSEEAFHRQQRYRRGQIALELLESARRWTWTCKLIVLIKFPFRINRYRLFRNGMVNFFLSPLIPFYQLLHTILPSYYSVSILYAVLVAFYNFLEIYYYIVQIVIFIKLLYILSNYYYYTYYRTYSAIISLLVYYYI